MKKHYNKYFDETYYTETLANGLTVIIFYKPEFSTSVCSFGSPYGALNINQKIKNKKYNFHPGIAHFLEHKLFEAKGDDMLNKFSSLGARVNAYTTYKETVYYFSYTGKDIEEPLNLLLDFVQDLDITEQSVEKEKGIINQELEMYLQMPDQRLLYKTYQALYQNYPLKYDIGGFKEAVYAIDKKELETCYKINYHPSNMCLCISSPLEPKNLMKIIRKNQKNKKFTKFVKPLSNNEKEPIEVAKKTLKFKMDISTDKHVLAIKCLPNFKDENDSFIKEFSLRILLEIYFSSMNPDYQRWLDENLINDFFGYEIDFCQEYAYVLFMIENNDKNILKKLVKETLKKDLLTKEKVEQVKRRYIGSMFGQFNDLENFNSNYIRYYLEGIDYFKALNDLRNISLKDVENSRIYLSFPQTSYINMVKK